MKKTVCAIFLILLSFGILIYHQKFCHIFLVSGLCIYMRESQPYHHRLSEQLAVRAIYKTVCTNFIILPRAQPSPGYTRYTWLFISYTGWLFNEYTTKGLEYLVL